MPGLNFKNTKILGVSQASKFIGGDVFRLSTTQTISIEGFIRAENADLDWDGASQVDENFSSIQGQINSMKAEFLTGGGFTDITLNEVPIGNGKIVSLDLQSMGYDKLLSTGSTKQSYKLTINAASAKAVEKIEAAGGEILNG